MFLAPSSPARLLIDASSLELVSGATVDYATELIGSSFRVRNNPHASDKGGCGCGVSESRGVRLPLAEGREADWGCVGAQVGS